MAIVECEVLIQAPVARVYQVSQDYAVRYEWDPFPEKIALLHGATDIAKGVQVRVNAKNGLQMDVEFVQLAPPHRAAITMVSGPLFIARFAGSWIFEEATSGHTLARFRYVVKMKTWTLPLVSEAIACRYFRRSVAARLAGLKAYCEK